jgi:ribonuclease P protein component
VLAAAERIRRRDEFAATIRSGGRCARGAVVAHVKAHLGAPMISNSNDPARADRSVPAARAGFVVSKAVGGAVVRNKVKRRLRHVMRARLADLPIGTDVVVRALPTAAGRTFAELDQDVAQALEAAARRTRRARQ